MNFDHSSPSLAQAGWNWVWERCLLRSSSAAIPAVSLTEMFLNYLRCSVCGFTACPLEKMLRLHFWCPFSLEFGVIFPLGMTDLPHLDCLSAPFECNLDGVFVWPRLGTSFSTPGPVTPCHHHFKICNFCGSPAKWGCWWGEEITSLTLVLSKIHFNEYSFAIKNKFTQELHLSMRIHPVKVIRIEFFCLSSVYVLESG